MAAPSAACPKIEGSWRYDGGTKTLEVTLAQKQAAEPFRLNVEIGIRSASDEMPRIERVELSDARKTYSWPLAAAPQSVVLDPQTTLLR